MHIPLTRRSICAKLGFNGNGGYNNPPIQLEHVMSQDENNARDELNEDYTGTVVSINEAMVTAGVSKVTLLKMIRAAQLQPVGKRYAGGRGRPANLFDADDMQAAIVQRSSADSD
jgi:hypothetical protein